VKLAQDHGYDGLDMDYEHLWSAADRPGFIAFMTALSTAMHAAGKELSNGHRLDPRRARRQCYPYEALSGLVDTLHVMDLRLPLHRRRPPRTDRAARLVDAHVCARPGHRPSEKFMLGLANYAIGDGWWTSTRDALTRCAGSLSTTTTHMQSCSFGVWTAGRSPHCDTSSGTLWFEDLGSMEEKIASAKAHAPGGHLLDRRRRAGWVLCPVRGYYP